MVMARPFSSIIWLCSIRSNLAIRSLRGISDQVRDFCVEIVLRLSLQYICYYFPSKINDAVCLDILFSTLFRVRLVRSVLKSMLLSTLSTLTGKNQSRYRS